LHTATLLHDDVVDMSDLRRGKPTANAKWGNAPSVLVGDFVYSRAFQIMVSIGNMDVLKLLSDTTAKIAEGEVKQLMHVGDTSLSQDDYFKVIEYKTAVLFSAACEGAAILANSSTTQREACAAYGLALGNAFQLIDDTLDYVGESAQLGKNVGDDLAEGKVTLPLIYALEATKANNPAEHDFLLHTIRNKSVSDIEQVIQVVQKNNAVGKSKHQAECAASKGQTQLSHLHDSPYTQALSNLATFVIERKK